MVLIVARRIPLGTLRAERAVRACAGSLELEAAQVQQTHPTPGNGVTTRTTTVRKRLFAANRAVAPEPSRTADLGLEAAAVGALVASSG